MGKLTIVKTDGNIDFVEDIADGVSGFLANGVAVAGGVQLDTVYRLRSLKDVLDLKIDDGEALVYEHLKEAYRINPSADIRLLLVDKSTSYVDMVDPAEADNAAKLLLSQEGDIKMLFVSYNPTTTISDFLDTKNAITKAQSLYDSEAVAKRDVHIFLEGKGFNITGAEATDFKGLNAANVSVVTGQAYSVAQTDATYAAIGTVMGVYSKIPVNQSGAWVERNNLLGGSLTEAAIGGVSISAISDGAMATMDEYGSIFFKRQIPVSGLYMNGADVCDNKGNTDYYTVELNRTINKIITIMRLTITPSLSEPMKVDPATGFLPPEKVLDDQASLEKAIKDSMLVVDEISGIQVRLNPFQNMIENPNRIIQYKVVPTSTGEEITAEVGFAASI